MKIKVVLFLSFICLFFIPVANAQTSCKPPDIVFNRNTGNIFSETQEMFLGEVMAETFEKDYRIIKDEQVNRYVRAIGEKLTKHLPPTNIKFQFFVVDVPDVNAFAVAGGRIYITRKMISFVRSEDELAGIIGHELGHGIVRHNAIDMSRYFKEILGVTSVGDKKDIFEKYNQFIDKRNTKQIADTRNHEDDQQLEADRVGLFAMTAAGYDPKAFSSAWDRLTDTKGKTGNAFTEFFGTTRPAEKRLRELLKATSALPKECQEVRASNANEEFEKWQSFVVTTATFQKAEKLKGLIAKNSLNPYLRGEVRHLQFSPDGNYIVAQDASGINILKREPFSFVFRINVEDARPASFTPDSKHISFQTAGLRVEKWNIEEKKPVFAREAYFRNPCWQSTLSPDGKYLVCYSKNADLEIVDAETNETVLKKEKFYIPSFFEYYTWSFLTEDNEYKEIDALQMEFSPNSKYFLGGRVFRFNRGGSSSIGGIFYTEWGIDADQDAFIAYDLQNKKEVKLGGDLKNIVSMPFAFYSEDKIVGQHRKDPEKSGIFNFPSGERVEKFFMNADSYTKPYKGDYLFVRPTTKNPVGAYDFKTKKFFASNKTAALDGYDDYFVSESSDGILNLVKVDKEAKAIQEIGNLALPRNDLGDVKTITLSPDFDWLTLSESTRGGVWNLKNGEMKIYIRGFRGAYFDADGKIYADFPSFEGQERAMVTMNPVEKNSEILKPVDTRNTKQYGKFLVRLKTKQDEKSEKKQNDKTKTANQGRDEDSSKNKPVFTFEGGFLTGMDTSERFLRDGTLEIYDARSRNLLWSKVFGDEIPKYEVSPTGETIALYWTLTTKTAKNEIKNNPELSQKLKALGEKAGDYLVEILDANTGKSVGSTLIETGEGSFSIKHISTYDDWLTIVDSENRVLLYSLKQGKLIQRFFGSSAVVNPAKRIALVENVPGQLSIYNLDDGQKIDELSFPSSSVYSAFSSDGKKLFILTANQNYYLLDTEKFGK